METTVVYGGLMTVLLDQLGYLILAVGGVLIARYVKPALEDWVGVQATDQMITEFNRGLELAIAAAREELDEWAPVSDMQLDVRNELVAKAANYVIPKFRETMEQFDIDELGIAERLKARLGLGL